MHDMLGPGPGLGDSDAGVLGLVWPEACILPTRAHGERILSHKLETR